MSKAPAVIIPEKHQSAPKQHPVDKEILKAADEIDSGRYTPPAEQLKEFDQLPNVALRTGTPEMLEHPVSRADFAHTENTLILAEHPRVKEAMARLEKERDDARTTQEYVEKAQMLHELNRASRQKDQWEGQERWQGEESQESRRGLILSPMQFYYRLTREINPASEWKHHTFVVEGNIVRAFGVPPILLGREAVLQHKDRSPNDQAGRVPLLVIGSEKIQILLPGMPDKPKDEPLVVATLQWPYATEWMMMNFDQFGVPTTARHIGWRTALLTMIRSGIITEKQAHRAFPVGSGPAASWYKEQLFEWRNSGRPARA